MSRILRIEDVKIINENGNKIARYVFNDDRVVRVSVEDDEVLTKNVSKDHLNLIGYYSSINRIPHPKKTIIENKEDNDLVILSNSEVREYIKSGKGAGVGVFIGILVSIIGGIIGGIVSGIIIGQSGNLGIAMLIGSVVPLSAALLAPKYLENISDKKYLQNSTEDEIKNVNFLKGFYPTIIFGGIVALFCCKQWKEDMLDVLDEKPNQYNKNKHTCFVIWEVIWFLIIPVLSIALLFISQ